MPGRTTATGSSVPCIAPLPDPGRLPELPRFPGPPKGLGPGSARVPPASSALAARASRPHLQPSQRAVPLCCGPARARARSHADFAGPAGQCLFSDLAASSGWHPPRDMPPPWRGLGFPFLSATGLHPWLLYTASSGGSGASFPSPSSLSASLTHPVLSPHASRSPMRFRPA